MSKAFKAMGIVVLLMGMVFVFAGCGGGDSLEGTWVGGDDGETIEITSDTITVQAGEMGDLEFKYRVEGDNLVLTMEGLPETTIGYKVDGDTLTITSEGETTTYTRQ